MDQYTRADIVDIDVIMENPFVRFRSLKINTM